MEDKKEGDLKIFFFPPTGTVLRKFHYSKTM